MNELTEAMVKTIKAAAKKMTGANRRAFEAQAALDYLGGDSRLAETVFGWSRKTVSKGLEELRRGSVIPDLPRNSVRRTEETLSPKSGRNSPRTFVIWSNPTAKPIRSFRLRLPTPA